MGSFQTSRYLIIWLPRVSSTIGVVLNLIGPNADFAGKVTR
jgi:hypothetical protein